MTMLRFALFGVVLCAIVIGLSEQTSIKNIFLRLKLREVLDDDAKEIKEIGNHLRRLLKSKVSKDRSKLQYRLDLITEIASRLPDNRSASSIKNLDSRICDESRFDEVRNVKKKAYSDQVRRQAKPLLDTLIDYESQVQQNCVHDKLVEISGLDDLVISASDISLGAQLELIASRGNNSALAALLAGLNPEICDPSHLKKANKALRAIADRKLAIGFKGYNLLAILKSYKEQVGLVCLEKAAEVWSDGRGALEEGLASENLEKIVQLTDAINQWDLLGGIGSYLPKPDCANYPLSDGYVPVDILNRMRDLISKSTNGSGLESSWTLRFTEARRLFERELFEPCNALLKIEQGAAILGPISESISHSAIQKLASETGKLDDTKSEVARWVSRWGACKWLKTLNSSVLAAISAYSVRLRDIAGLPFDATIDNKP